MKNIAKVISGVVIGIGVCAGLYYLSKKIDDTESFDFEDDDDCDFDSDIDDDFDEQSNDYEDDGREYFEVGSGKLTNFEHEVSDESSGI